MCTDQLVCVMQKQCVFCEVGYEFYTEYNFDNSRLTVPTLSQIAENLRLNWLRIFKTYDYVCSMI
jgi:hypothetical protein